MGGNNLIFSIFLFLILFLNADNVSLSKDVPSIQGVVLAEGFTDLPVSEIAVTLRDMVTSLEQTVKTNINGVYKFENLKSENPYAIRINAPGFKPEIIEGVVLHAGRTRRIDFNLRLEGHGDVSIYHFGEFLLPIIEGVVLNEDSRPLSNASVKLSGIGANVRMFLPSEDDGEFIGNSLLKERQEVEEVKTDENGIFRIILATSKIGLLNLDALKISVSSNGYEAIEKGIRTHLKISEGHVVPPLIEEDKLKIVLKRR